MTTWIIPNKAADYDVRRGLSTYSSEIEWTKKLATTNIAISDMVYLYESAPVKAITMKFIVTNSNVIVPNQTHDNYGAVVGDKWFKIRFLENVDPIPYDTLLGVGVVNGYIRAARKLTQDQEDKLEEYIANSISPLVSKILSDSSLSSEEIAEEVAGLGDMNSINATLQTLEASMLPERIQQVVSRLVRNPRVALLAKQAREYICEICDRKPFIKKNGEPYAEADHIQPLGGGHNGIDSPENIRCLCAQCHAIVTYGSDEVIKVLLSTTKWRS